MVDDRLEIPADPVDRIRIRTRTIDRAGQASKLQLHHRLQYHLTHEIHVCSIVSVQDNTLSISLDNPDDQTPPLLTSLVGAGALIRSAEPLSHSLEEVYMQLVGNAGN